MDILKALNLVVRFLLELCMLAAIGDWGFKTGSGWALKIIFGIGLPVLIATLWWLAWRLRGTSRLTLELTLLGSGAIALSASGKQDLAWLYTIVLAINKFLIIVWKQQSEPL